MSKRILVSGGAGFLGSHLCERLLVEGNEVISLDNYYTGTPDNLKHLQDDPRLTMVEGDVNDPRDLGALDQIFHMACPASPVHYSAIR